ncbi:MAG TPA: hypothetical protein VGB30_01590 [bacterium]|jgi:hypothetical protein
MLSRSLVAFAVLTALIVLTSCSGGHPPVAPSPDDTTPALNTQADPASSDGRYSWGMWQVRINAETTEAEIIPLRGANWHVNALTFLESGSKSTIVLKDIIIDGGSVELNVGLIHPFIGLMQWSGLDVKGVFMTDGSYNDFQTSGDTYISDVGEPKLLNADGWTRWWNQSEFPITNSILGFTDGVYGPNLIFRSTVNPFKYFSDDLSQNEIFPDDLILEKRGLFTASGNVNWRHYSIDFGQPAQWYIFNYAVDASHKFKQGENGNSSPSISELPSPFFELDANQPEAFAVVVEEGFNSLYYVDNTSSGGDLALTLKIYDWQASENPGGISGEVTEVLVESPRLIGAEVLQAEYLDGTGDDYQGEWKVTLTDTHPLGRFDQDILITVVSSTGSFDDGYDGFSTSFQGNPDTLKAYQLHTPPVSDEIPTQQSFISVLAPNGGEEYLLGSNVPISWTSSSGISFVDIDWTINGVDWNSIGIQPNTGSYSWNTSLSPIPPASENLVIRISDASDPATFDQSDAAFALETLTLDYPNAADDLEIGIPMNITWSTGTGGANVIEYLDIWLSLDGGVTYTFQLNSVDEPNDGSFSWTPQLAHVTTQARIRILDIDKPTVFIDESDGNFEIFEKHELTLAEYQSWFDGGTLSYRGRYTTTLSTLSQSYYNGTNTSWDFTTTPFTTHLGGSNFNMTFTSTPPKLGWSGTWGSGVRSMRTSIAGPAGRQPYWVFNFDSANNDLYNKGSHGYIDADKDLATSCLSYIATTATHQFTLSSNNDIQFPLDENSGTTNLVGSGTMYWQDHSAFFCTPSNGTINISYNSGSVWEIMATGDVTVPKQTSGSQNYPHCLLVKLKVNVGPTSFLIHTGQLLYQWIDMDSGTVVAFMWTHNEGNGSVPEIPFTTGFSGDQVLRGIIGAYRAP